MRTYLTCGSALALALAISTGSARAQERQPGTANAAPAASEPAQDDQKSSVGLEEIVVTARKVEEKLQDVPVAVSAISGASLDRLQIRSPQDLTYQVPSLDMRPVVSDPGSSIAIGIRGQENSQAVLGIDVSVGLYIDGINQPRPFGFKQNLIDIQRIEVLRGPQGTLYGRNATGGAMSLYTHNPEFQPGGYVELSAGERNTARADAMLNLPISDTLAFRIAGSKAIQDGYVHDAVGRELGDYDSSFLRAKLLWQPSPDFSAMLFGSYNHTTSGGGPLRLVSVNLAPSATGITPTLRELAVYAGIAPASSPTLTPDQLSRAQALFASYANTGFYQTAGTAPNYSHFRSRSAGLDLNYNISNQITLRSLTGYQHFNRDNQEDIDGTPAEINTVDLHTVADFASEEIQLTGNHVWLTWVVGGFGSYENGTEASRSFIRTLTNGPNTPGYILGDSTNKSIAAYGQVSVKPIRGITVTGGARYTIERREGVARHTTTSNGNIVCNVPLVSRDAPNVCAAHVGATYRQPTWLASISYEPTADLMFYAKASRGFRSGGFNIRGSTAASYIPFQPEIAQEYEIGAKTEFWDRRIRFNLAAYHTDYSDIQRNRRVVDPGTGVPVTVVGNAASAKIDGVEAELTARLTPQLTVGANYSYTNPRYVSYFVGTADLSNQDFGIAKHMASVSADYSIPISTGEIDLHADYSRRSQQVMDPTILNIASVTQKPYGLLNASVSLNIDAWNARVSVNARNIAGVEYISNAIGFDTNAGYNLVVPGEPRYVGLTFLKRFGKASK